MNIPRLVIAGTNSGCGKTTIATGIMAAFVKKGFKVQPFKVGPDYIDPMFHTFITGNASRNLDSWMLTEETVLSLFARNAEDADISIIEGVMGMYDGFGAYEDGGSTAHIARITKSPVILVLNGEGMALSIAAVVKGFREMDRSVDLKGVIINGIKTENHYKLLKEIIEENTGVAAVGYLPRMNEFSLKSRHLGLVPSEEIDDLRIKLDKLSTQIEQTVDLEQLYKMAGDTENISCKSVIPFFPSNGAEKVRIAIARDKAFNFYYEDNFELLKMLGAELEFFSPISDPSLPEGISGLYIGGGYPEVWGKELQENRAARKSIKEAVIQGLPVYAECGGLMYLTQSIKNRDGEVFETVGAIPGYSEMTSSLQRFGYVEVEAQEDNVISQRGDKIRAHEFHYSDTKIDGNVTRSFKVLKSRRNSKNTNWNCGYTLYNMLASYPHLHFWSNTDFAERFVNSCVQWKHSRNGVENV